MARPRDVEPSPRQLELLVFLADCERLGSPASFREMCEALGTNSTNNANELLQRLERHGLVERRGRPAFRGVRLTAAGRRLVGAPCCSCSRCGCDCHGTGRTGPAAGRAA